MFRLRIDLSHTAHTRAATGVQRVCRGIFHHARSLTDVEPVTFDPFENRWRALDDAERGHLDNPVSPEPKRSARWSPARRWKGRMRRWVGAASPDLPPADGCLVPEIFSPAAAARFADLFDGVSGPHAAVFHDAIALQFPELSPPGTVARFPAYLRELATFDGVAAVSEDSAAALRDYWNWAGIHNPPPIAAIPLGAEPPAAASPRIPSGRLTILCVASLEGRKNHPALLTACETLWNENLEFDLELIGMTHRETGRAAARRIDELGRRGRPLRLLGPVSDSELEAAYRRCSFTVYPSLKEGFGLPVLESVIRGRPCVCSSQGALGEAARKGGCLALESVDAGSLTGVIRKLLTDPALRERLAAEARRRPVRSMKDHAGDLLNWLRSLRVRDA